MPPIPTQCQSIKNDVDALELQAQTLKNDAVASTGQAAWTKLGQLGLVLQQLDRRRADLDACVNARTGSLVCEFVLMDAGGGGTTGDRLAHLWDLSGAEPVLLETATVQAGSFAFSGAVPAGPAGLTIAGTDSTTATGPDFRSGAVTALPPGPPRVEIVLGPVVTVTADDISRWFNTEIAAAPAQRLDIPGVGSVELKIDSVAVALAPSTIRLTGGGTLTLPAVIVGDPVSPLSATVTLGLVPSTSADAVLPAELTLVGQPRIELSGSAALFGAVLNLALSTSMSSWIFDLMRNRIRDEVVDAAARALSLAHLPPPPAITLSLRKLSVDSSAITFQPTLGAFGTVLSTYQPVAAEVVSP